MSDARRAHYADLYEPHDPAAPDARTSVVVLGNCQAESLRIMLAAPDVRALRVPPVQELTRDDLPALARMLATVDILVSQPVRDDYRGLPLGHRQLIAQLGQRARHVLVPVVRYAGLYPEHAIVRPPSDPSLSPPVVGYHNLRVLAESAGLSAPTPVTTAAQARRIGAASIAQLRLREDAHGTVVISDLFERPDFELMRTINHPGNRLWSSLAARVRDRTGLAANPVDPGRPLLASVHAPRSQAAIEAFGLTDAPRDYWEVDGQRIAADDMDERHRGWYREHPDAVTAGLSRHAEALAILGFA